MPHRSLITGQKRRAAVRHSLARGAPFCAPLFGRTCWTWLNPPLYLNASKYTMLLVIFSAPMNSGRLFRAEKNIALSHSSPINHRYPKWCASNVRHTHWVHYPRQMADCPAVLTWSCRYTDCSVISQWVMASRSESRFASYTERLYTFNFLYYHYLTTWILTGIQYEVD